MCEGKAGADETTARAAAWVEENLAGADMSPPRVSGGETYVTF